MSTYVLVHGAWGGSYGFRKLRPLLRAAGHEVFTPSLTGIGERSHLTSPQVSLSTHILDVVNTIRYEDLDDIVLLGFSYGGMVVTGALEHIGDRVRDLVYLDAFVPGDGDSVSTLRGDGLPAGTELGTPWLISPLEREYPSPELAAPDLPGLELPRDRHQPPGRGEPPARAGRPPPHPRSLTASSPHNAPWAPGLGALRLPGRAVRR